MRSRKRLVQVQVHQVDAEIAGARLPDQRVHVGAVHVEQAALSVQNLGDLVDLLLEDAQRVGVGEHERGDIFVHLRCERGDVDHAAGVRLQILDGIVHHGSGRGIRAMGGVWNQDSLARIALRLVISPHHQQAGHFAVRTGGGLQRDRIHAGDFDQALAQGLDDVQRALGNLLRLVRMAVGNALDASDGFIHARVVLHRARSQRVHAQIDGVVPRRKPGEVTDDLDLAHLGHVAQVVSFGIAEQLRQVWFRHIERRKLPGRLAGRGLLEDQSLVLADVAGGFSGHVLHRATSSTSSFADRTERSLSATRPTAVSMALRVVNSVQHHNAALPSSG